MPTPDQYRRALVVVTDRSVAEAMSLLATSTVDEMLVAVPDVIAHFSDGSAALAADQYDELREAARARGTFTAEPIVNLREERIRRGVLWAVEPLADDPAKVASRLAEVVSLETARPFRDTITTNRRRDPAAVGWRRNAGLDGCKFCRMLAANGAVYRESTVRFAAHPHCTCTASPVFEGEPGEEASVEQCVASRRRRTAEERAALRRHLNERYPHAHG